MFLSLQDAWRIREECIRAHPSKLAHPKVFFTAHENCAEFVAARRRTFAVQHATGQRHEERHAYDQPELRFQIFAACVFGVAMCPLVKVAARLATEVSTKRAISCNGNPSASRAKHNEQAKSL